MGIVVIPEVTYVETLLSHVQDRIRNDKLPVITFSVNCLRLQLHNRCGFQQVGKVQTVVSDIDSFCDVISEFSDEFSEFILSGTRAPHSVEQQLEYPASDVLVEIFGDAGRHVRAAIGVSALPRTALVELQMTVEI